MSENYELTRFAHLMLISFCIFLISLLTVNDLVVKLVSFSALGIQISWARSLNTVEFTELFYKKGKENKK